MITHGVDYQKIEKIKQNKLNCIQIDGNKWFNIKNSLELDQISTYIFTVEKNLEEIYSDLYKIYKEKTEQYNNQYILDKDLQYIVFDKNAFYINNNEGFCFNCYKELKYDNQYLIYRHKKYLDFYLCHKNPKLYLNFEILDFIQKRGIQYFIKGSTFSLNNNSLTIFNEYYSLDIRPEQINILKLIEIIKNEHTVNFIDILNLTAEQNNLINNGNLFDEFLSNLYNKELILDSIKIKCPFCQEEKGKHKYSCSFFYNDFQKKIEYKVNNILINKISLADEYLEKEDFTNLIIINEIINSLNNTGININKNNFYILKIDTDILGVYIKIDENQENQLLFTIHFNNNLYNNIIPYKYTDSCNVIIDYNILTQKNNIDFYNIKINNSNAIFNYNLRDIINKFLINNSEYVKRFKEIFVTHNLIQSKDIHCFKYVNESNNYKYSTNKDGKSLFEVYINKKMKTSDHPAIFIDYTYDNNNLNIQECCDFNLENIFYLLNICFKYHWLIGEKFLLKNKKYIKYIEINKRNLYNIKIGEVEHTLYLHNNNLDYEKYSLSIDVSNIKNINDFNHFLDKPREYIKYNTYSSERNIFYAHKILKLKEERLNKIKEQNDIKKNKKEQKNNYLMDISAGNNTVRNFLSNNNNNLINNLKIFINNRIKEQFFAQKIKIFSISPFLKDLSDVSKNDIYSNYKLNTYNDSLLLISKFSDKLSIENNFAIFILKILLYGKGRNNIIIDKLNIIKDKIKYVLFFNEYLVKFEDKRYSIDFSDKLILNNFIPDKNFYIQNKELFDAYFIKTKNYHQIKGLTKNEILNLKKFDFLSENDINIAIQKIK